MRWFVLADATIILLTFCGYFFFCVLICLKTTYVLYIFCFDCDISFWTVQLAHFCYCSHYTWLMASPHSRQSTKKEHQSKTDWIFRQFALSIIGKKWNNFINSSFPISARMWKSERTRSNFNAERKINLLMWQNVEVCGIHDALKIKWWLCSDWKADISSSFSLCIWLLLQWLRWFNSRIACMTYNPGNVWQKQDTLYASI